jgi:trehalose 6-phosphate synthase
MAARPIMIVSNRGPVSFRRDDDGELVARRGAGGLVSGLAPLVAGTSASWLATAISDDDRAAVAGQQHQVIDADGLHARLLELDPDDYRMAYDVVCNATLWFVHHHLFDLARRPRFDDVWWEAWDAYRRVNEAFADEVADDAPEGAAILVQDYHLCLLAPALLERRPDLRIVHVSHTPFAAPELLAVLPTRARRELLQGMAAHHACGFHSARWAANFVASCEADGIAPPATFVAPLGPDPDDLAATAATDACRAEGAQLDSELAGRRLVLRVDRVELSKNLLRGFHAFDVLLEDHPEWREQVVFAAFVYPSREGLSDYLSYAQEVDGLVRRLNEKWATPGWTPILYDASDNYPRSVAALQRFDVLLVNPIRDGLNLVAKEGMLVNERDGLLALSPGAGAWDELGEHALEAHPYDLTGTAEALHRGLSIEGPERAAQSAALRAAAAARTPADWLDDQLRAAGSATG